MVENKHKGFRIVLRNDVYENGNINFILVYDDHKVYRIHSIIQWEVDNDIFIKLRSEREFVPKDELLFDVNGRLFSTTKYDTTVIYGHKKYRKKSLIGRYIIFISKRKNKVTIETLIKHKPGYLKKKIMKLRAIFTI